MGNNILKQATPTELFLAKKSVTVAVDYIVYCLSHRQVAISLVQAHMAQWSKVTERSIKGGQRRYIQDLKNEEMITKYRKENYNDKITMKRWSFLIEGTTADTLDELKEQTVCEA
ncbi:hypothetical protein KIN20_027999 [Parelaphostrongylus tenuis]|uniref:Uncharacterized protein n=1 Tax=Parelaphostrongylus tenuis TaxID=148309 RepID=A0AAD5WE98_PARTN|nr:hypothetical protein KIN20_027999 [Parelaphostrongylus tenuis]